MQLSHGTSRGGLPRPAPPGSSGPARQQQQQRRQQRHVAAAAGAAATPVPPPPPQQQPAAARGAAPAEIVRLSPASLDSGGLDLAAQPPESIAGFARQLATAFTPVDLAWPGLRVQNIDPPVITIDDFMPPDVCDALLEAAKASGRMQPSRIGTAGTGAGEDVRTSSTLAITREVLADVPALRPPLERLLAAAAQLVGSGMDTSALAAAQFVRPTSHEQLCPELPQVAHYLPGQHFLAHEDGFPSDTALAKGYNRRATLLVYLNDVPHGGRTVFDHLSLGVAPRRGRALLFFPCFSGGKSDARTLHTAEDAAEGCEKWVFQLWLCSGLPRRPPIDAAAAAVQQLAAARQGGGGSKGSKAKRPNKKKR